MLQVRLFGQFDVRADGKRVAIASRAGQSLLAYLLLSAGTAHRRERLAGLLWPDISDDRARRNLRQELWRVRKAIGSQLDAQSDIIQADEYTVTFNRAADYWLDVAQLDRPVAPDEALSDLINQLQLYQGELLPGFYDDWIVLERERLQAQFENKMKRLLEDLCREQRWSTVLEWGERWIALGQTPEPAYRALMAAYAALGDRAKMAATFERALVALDKDLGVEPSAETRALYDQLLKEHGEALSAETLELIRLASANLPPVNFVPPALRHDEPPAPGEPPFMGLQYFDEADADLFFGRELLTARLVAKLRESKFLAVIVGASGSGKSSIVRAGLLPALKRGQPLADDIQSPDGSSQWRVTLITPTAHPLEALALALTRDVESVTATATLLDDLARDPRSLSLYLKRGTAEAKLPHCLLVVDQFEELFTLCHDEFEREAFIDNLLTAVLPSPLEGRGDGGEGKNFITLILTIRADFYAHLAHYSELRDAVAGQQAYIGPMTSDELRRAIEEPAKREGWTFESGLVDLILRDVGDEPGALPLLSHALLETWQRRSGRMLTLKGYADSGGVHGAIAYTAENVYQQLSPDQQLMARQIFLRLTELGEGTDDTRRRTALRELLSPPEQSDQIRVVLNALATARLITLHEDTAEVAHEALIREWPRLREWLTEDREGLQLHRHLTEATHDWEMLDRDPGALYRGARLAQAAEWAVANANALNQPERAFLQASQALEQHEVMEREAQRQRELAAAQTLADTQQQANRRLRRRAVFLLIAFVLAIGMASVALFFGEQARQTTVTAQRERVIATSRELAAAALNNLTTDPERSILLALQAVSTTRAIDGAVLPEAAAALHQSIVASPLRLSLTGHGTRVLSAAYNPDGTQLATLGDDGTTIIWNTANGQELHRWPGATQPADLVTTQRLAYNSAGTLLAACDNHQIKLFDATTYEQQLTLNGQQADMTAVAFSRDGTRIAASDSEGMVFVWDAVTGDARLNFNAHTDVVEDLTFSPDGQWLVTASDDATIKFWNAATGDLLRSYADFTGEIIRVAFSPDGTRLAFATVDGLHVWQLDFQTVDGGVTVINREDLTIPEAGGVSFSSDGTQLAAPSLSGTGGNAIKLWDAATGRELLTLLGHTGWVMGVAISPDGQRLASASLDGTVKVWSLTPGQETVVVAATGAGYGTRLAYNPIAAEFATNGGDGTATLWDAETGQSRLKLAGHNLEVLSVAYSSDGQRFATGSLDANAIIWDALSGQQLLTLSGHSVGVRDVTFSPDRSRVATASFDGTARVWDALTGAPVLTITGHSGVVLGVAFSPDGQHLATSSTDRTAKIWNAQTGELEMTLSGHEGAIPDIAYSPDGTKLATGSGDGTAIVWDAATGTKLLTLVGHSSQIQAVSFSPDGQLLATGSEDNTAKIWAMATGQEVLSLPGSAGGVAGVVFSSLDGGAHLVVASNDGVVRAFQLRIEDLLALAQTRVTRSLTAAECQKYLHTEQCPAQP